MCHVLIVKHMSIQIVYNALGLLSFVVFSSKLFYIICFFWFINSV